jgi:prevent-host-death family protein
MEAGRMPEIGVRELKTRASEIIRMVRDHRARYLVTYRGRPVGVLAPIPETARPDSGAEYEQSDTTWEELVDLGEQIRRGWKATESGVEILSEMRR